MRRYKGNSMSLVQAIRLHRNDNVFLMKWVRISVRTNVFFYDHDKIYRLLKKVTQI